ncbi:MAG: hypothetical protein AB1489_16805 [Acidobacteriota bacterium]
MSELKKDLKSLHEKLHATLVEIEVALDTETYPDWTVVKDRLLESIEVVRKLERDQLWNKLGKK